MTLRTLLALVLFLPVSVLAATTPYGVAFVGDDLHTARLLYHSQTSLINRDCDPVGDGRWICASYSNPRIEHFLTGASGRFSGLPVAVFGQTLTSGHKKFKDATILPRVDCDPAGSGWVCASFIDPVLDDVHELSPNGLTPLLPFRFPPNQLTSEPEVIVAANAPESVFAHQVDSDSLFEPGDLMVLNYDSCPDPDDLHAVVAGRMVLDGYGLRHGTDYIVSNGTCGDLRPRSDYIDNSYLVFDKVYGNSWHDVFNNETGSIIAVAEAIRSRLNTGAKVWVLDGGPMDFTARVVRQLEATGFTGDLKNITVVQHSHGWNEDYTDPVNLHYMARRVNYEKIDNGNFANNQTAQLNQRNDLTSIPNVDQNLVQRFLDDPSFGDYWETSFNVFKPNRKFDGSDTVELLWVLGLNSDYVADWYDFAEFFLEDGLFAPGSFTVTNATGATDPSVNSFQASINQLNGQSDPDADGYNGGLPGIDSQAFQQGNGSPSAPLAHSSDDVIFIADYESGQVSSGVSGVQALSPPADDAITVSSNVSRSGQNAINHRIRYSDDYISAGAWRAESNSINVQKSRYDQGDKIRYQFSIYLPPSWNVDHKDSIDAIWQWKRFSSRPDMFVLIRGADIELRALRSSRRTVLKNYRVGEWIDLQFDVVHSADNDGSVKMYYKYASEHTYTLADEYKGATMLSGGPVDSTYLKWGLYKPDFDLSSYPEAERSIYHDDIRVLNLN